MLSSRTRGLRGTRRRNVVEALEDVPLVHVVIYQPNAPVTRVWFLSCDQYMQACLCVCAWPCLYTVQLQERLERIAYRFEPFGRLMKPHHNDRAKRHSVRHDNDVLDAVPLDVAVERPERLMHPLRYLRALVHQNSKRTNDTQEE